MDGCMNDKPREEKSYKSLYPGLSASKHLSIVNPIFRETREHRMINEKICKEKTKMHDLNSIEYTATQQDHAFLVSYFNNNEDFKRDYECIAVNLYELIMDRILKEWRLWQMRIINQYYANCYRKKSKQSCAICTSETESEGNLILVCNGCSLHVHQECYGVPNLEKFTSIEEARKSFYFLDSLWFCRKCLFFKEKVPKCKYCNIDGNAYKQVQNTKRWGHVLCVKFIDTLNFSNSVFLEPIEELKFDEQKYDTKTYSQSKTTGKENVQKTCFICNYRKGGVVKCGNKSCDLHYHVTCGINSLFYFDLKNEVSYCNRHDPENTKTEDNFSLNLLEKSSSGLDAQENYINLKHVPEVRKRIPIFVQEQTIIHKVAHLRPRFTDFVANRIICSDLCMFDDRLITNFVIEVGMFWNVRNNRYYEVEDIFSLDGSNWEKWDERRNIICIKSDMKKKKIKLNEDNSHDTKTLLLKIRDIYNVDTNQEEHKRMIQSIFNVILGIKCNNIHIKTYGTDLHDEIRHFLMEIRDIFLTLKQKEILEQEMLILKNESLNYLIDDGWRMFCILQELRNIKSFSIFENPVTEKIAPGYYKVIKKPMCFKQIHTKIKESNYKLDSFREDIQTIINNCRLYNAECDYFINLSDSLENTTDSLIKKYANLKLNNNNLIKIREVINKQNKWNGMNKNKGSN